MGQERAEAQNVTPREVFFAKFKASVINFEPGEWKRVGEMSGEEIFNERKKWTEQRIGGEVTEREYIEEWIRNPNLGKNASFELGVAYGQMLMAEKIFETIAQTSEGIQTIL